MSEQEKDRAVETAEEEREQVSGAAQEARDGSETVETANDPETAEAPEGSGIPEGSGVPEPADGEGGEPDRKAAKKEAKSLRKKEKADKKSEALKEKITELEDRVKRQMAEFENFRKRTEKEKTAMFETGAKSVIEKILPVVDNFERGFQGMSEQELEEPFAKGMKMVYDQLTAELENLGVKPIEAVGCEFDPELHNAVMQVESEEYEEGVIAQELLKGYTYRDSVVRHSMVAVTQ